MDECTSILQTFLGLFGTVQLGQSLMLVFLIPATVFLIILIIIFLVVLHQVEKTHSQRHGRDFLNFKDLKKGDLVVNVVYLCPISNPLGFQVLVLKAL
jgi:hypothetical protein